MSGRALIAAVRRRARAHHSEAAGLGLVELIVAMALTTIALSMVVGLYMSTTRASGITQSIDSATRNSANEMNELTRVIRGAADLPVQNSYLNSPALVYADNTQLVLYSLVDADAIAPRPTMVQFRMVNGSLQERRWTATTSGTYSVFGNYATAQANSSRTLGPLTAPTTANPLFRYSAAGTTLASGTLTEAQRRSVGSVQITLTVVASSGTSTNATTLTRTVSLANLGAAG